VAKKGPLDQDEELGEMKPSNRSRVLAAAATLLVTLAIPAVASAAYGAIAVNQSTGAWGASYHAPAKWYAERQALRKCAGECDVMVWVRNRCAAVVIGRTKFVAGMAGTKRAAIRVARRRAHDHKARLLAWVCSG
jgi:Domain of unknown function (DUF4189)